jgi:hypothetical protein
VCSRPVGDLVEWAVPMWRYLQLAPVCARVKERGTVHACSQGRSLRAFAVRTYQTRCVSARRDNGELSFFVSDLCGVGLHHAELETHACMRTRRPSSFFFFFFFFSLAVRVSQFQLRTHYVYVFRDGFLTTRSLLLSARSSQGN